MLSPGPPLTPPATRAAACCATSCCTASTTASTCSSACSTGSGAGLQGGVGAASGTSTRDDAGRPCWSPPCWWSVWSLLLSRVRRDRRRRARAAAVLPDDRPVGRRAAPPGRGGARARGATPTRSSTRSARWPPGRSSGVGCDDQPGATAHEVAASLASSYPGHGDAGRPHRRPLRRDAVRRPAGRPARTPPACWPSTTPWRVRDEVARARQRGRHRVTVLVVVAALVAVAASAWLGRDNRTYPAALDPAQPRRQRRPGRGPGARPARASRSTSCARPTRSTGPPRTRSTTIVVTSSRQPRRARPPRGCCSTRATPPWWSSAPGPELVRAARRRRRSPRPPSRAAPSPAGCPAYDGLSLRVTTAEAYRADGCFRARAGVLAARPRAGLTLLGAPALLTNDQILEGDNAAVALRLLGPARPAGLVRARRCADLAGADGVSVRSLLPALAAPRRCGCSVVTGVALVAWRGRRLGPLAREPLPVVGQGGRDDPQPGPAVPAVRRPRPCGGGAARVGPGPARRTAATPPAASTRPGWSTTSPRRTGRPSAEVDALIGPAASPTRATDRELAALAQRLTELDREVSHR